MKRSLVTIGLLAGVLAQASTAHAENYCDDLALRTLRGNLAIAPIACKEATPKGCQDLQKKLFACAQKSGNKVIDEAAAKTAVDEQAFASAATQGGAKLQEIGGALGAKYILLAEVGGVGEAAVALLRVLEVETSTVVNASRLPLGKDTNETGTVQAGTVDQALSQLADKLAAGLNALGGKRSKRIAVLLFSESGEIAKKNGMGTLVSAELTTRMRRDHQMIVVERSRLDQVLKEFEVGQMGLIDEKNAPKLGKMVEAEAIVIGSVADAGEAVNVYARVIDTVTGVTLVADSASLRAANMITLASDAVVLRSKSGAVFRSLLIPGWGQMYNRQDIKGYTILGIVGALAGGSIAMQILNVMATNDYNKAGAGANFDSLAQKAENFAIARNIMLGTLGAVWIYNIIDAYVNGTTYDSALNTSVGSQTSSATIQITPAGVFGSF